MPDTSRFTDRNTILLVDDNPENLRVLIEHLGEYELNIAMNGDQALDVVQKVIPDLVLLDVMMPGRDGFEICKILKDSEKTREIPVIFMTALNDMKNKLKGFQAGGVDYITKPVQIDEALARINAHLTIRRQQKVLELQKEELEKKNALISEQSEKLEEQARTDPLTGLLNRRGFLDEAQVEVARFNRNNEPFAVLMCDLDFFKKVNDTFGHDCGDHVLQRTGVTIINNIREYDIAGRWGGEEFVILLPGCDKEAGRSAAEKIRSAIEQADFKHGDCKPTITMTLGVEIMENGMSLEDCINNADAALYDGKTSGRNRVCVFEQD